MSLVHGGLGTERHAISSRSNLKASLSVVQKFNLAIQLQKDGVLEVAATNLCKQAEMHGVEPRRLIFAARTDLRQHLARYRVADLALDTFPYTSHRTAMDALWMGCPLATLTGETFASRVAGSVLTVAGLRQLIAVNFDEYILLVKQLISDPGKIKRVRDNLESNKESSPLFDIPLFVHDLEGV